jgi:hypothetical protein
MLHRILSFIETADEQYITPRCRKNSMPMGACLPTRFFMTFWRKSVVDAN